MKRVDRPESWRRAIARRMAGASTPFHAEVIAPYLDDWRRELERASRPGSERVAWRIEIAYLSGLPSLWLASRRDRRRTMNSSPQGRFSPGTLAERLGARFLYVGAIAVPPIASGILDRFDSTAEVVSTLALALLLALGLVTIGLLVEARAVQPARGPAA